MNTDRNLLFGILAFQLNFIDRQAFLAAFDRWTTPKSKPIADLRFFRDIRRALTPLLKNRATGAASPVPMVQPSHSTVRDSARTLNARRR
jgi:hypothetical protein